MKLEDIINDVRTRMSEKRFIHSLGVMKRIEELAKIYGVDIEKAKKVGIAHDVAKEMSIEESFKYASENGISFDEIEKEIPYLLHSKIGADIAKKALQANIKKVVFDRSGYLYTGRVKALAEAARENGLEF